MLSWSPHEWGVAAFEVFGAFYATRFMFIFVMTLFGAERTPYTVNVTIEKD